MYLFIYLFIHPYIFFLTYLFSFISGAVLESPSCLQGEWVYLGGGGVPPYKKTVESEGSRKAQINWTGALSRVSVLFTRLMDRPSSVVRMPNAEQKNYYKQTKQFK